MSYISVTEKYIAVAKKLQIDVYDHSKHIIVVIPTPAKPQENDHLNDVIISSDSKYLATMTSSSKQLILYELPALNNHKVFTLPRSASKIRFTDNNTCILVADKSGDVLIYDITREDTGTKLLGHLSLLLDVLQTSNENFIITSDRDEKIKVSCYPNTYNIQTYCLGHKEFVNHIKLLPHDDNYLLSSSGDGTVKLWNYIEGKVCHTIDTYTDVSDDELKAKFAKKMDEEGIEVDHLPIVHLCATKLNESSSILAVSVHTYNMILIYSVNKLNDKFSYKLETKLEVDKFPTAIQLYNLALFVYNDSSCKVTFYNLIQSNGAITFEISKTEKAFENETNDQSNCIDNHFESIKVLFKRKFDNVQEYQERKKQRLEKSIKNVV